MSEILGDELLQPKLRNYTQVLVEEFDDKALYYRLHWLLENNSSTFVFDSKYIDSKWIS
jgi:hypothetical protein